MKFPSVRTKIGNNRNFHVKLLIVPGFKYITRISVQDQLTEKKSDNILIVLNLFYRVIQWFISRKNYNFPRLQGIILFSGEGADFSRRGREGVNCLYLWKPIELVIYQGGGGSGSPVPTHLSGLICTYYKHVIEYQTYAYMI